ncbi:MAG: dockerin type I repeat-containing protein [Patescibacteria group bacterium]
MVNIFLNNLFLANRPKKRAGKFFSSFLLLLANLFLFALPVSAYDWRETTRMPYVAGPYRSLAFDEPNRRIYLIGGREGPNYPDHPSNSTFLGVLNNDLSITWSNMSNLPVRLGSNAAVLYQGSIFSIGGEDGSSTGYSGNRIKNTYQGILNSSGAVTGWNNRSDMTLPNSSSRGQALVYSGNIYYFDGYNNKILKSNGGSWQQVGAFPQGLFFANVDRFTDFTVVISNNRIYLSGGQVANNNTSVLRCQLNNVYTAKFNADDTIGSWQKVRDHPDDVVQDKAGSGADLDYWGIKAYHSAVVHSGYLYIVGGSSANFTDNCLLPKTTYPGSNIFVNGLTGRTYRAKILTDGSLADWQIYGCQPGADCTQFDSLLWGGNNGFGAHLGGAFVYQDKLFLLGGLNYPGFTSKVVYLELTLSIPTSTVAPTPSSVVTNTPTRSQTPTPTTTNTGTVTGRVYCSNNPTQGIVTNVGAKDGNNPSNWTTTTSDINGNFTILFSLLSPATVFAVRAGTAVLGNTDSFSYTATGSEVICNGAGSLIQHEMCPYNSIRGRTIGGFDFKRECFVPTSTPSPTPIPLTPTPTPIPGDLDKNGRVDGLDVVYLISYLGNIAACPGCDLDHNGRVDGLDVIMLIGYL